MLLSAVTHSIWRWLVSAVRESQVRSNVIACTLSRLMQRHHVAMHSNWSPAAFGEMCKRSRSSKNTKGESACSPARGYALILNNFGQAMGQITPLSDGSLWKDKVYGSKSRNKIWVDGTR